MVWRTWVIGMAGVVLAGACSARGGSGASRVVLQPENGERHLKNVRQLTFGGNNAESYFPGMERC